LLSIGQAAFMGIGAYTSAILTKSYGWPFLGGVAAAAFCAAIASLVMAPITRLKGTYLAVATLGFTVIVFLTLLNEDWLTGGPFGLHSIPRASIATYQIRSTTEIYYLDLAFLACCFLALQAIVNGRFGRTLRAIKYDEEACRASGVNVTFYKSQAFVIASFLTGISGALYAHHNLFLSPNEFSFWRSIEIVLMVSIGGIGTMSGAIIGSFIVTLLPQVLQGLDEYRFIVFGVVLIICMGLDEKGITGLLSHGIERAWRALCDLKIVESVRALRGNR